MFKLSALILVALVLVTVGTVFSQEAEAGSNREAMTMGGKANGQPNRQLREYWNQYLLLILFTLFTIWRWQAGWKEKEKVANSSVASNVMVKEENSAWKSVWPNARVQLFFLLKIGSETVVNVHYIFWIQQWMKNWIKKLIEILSFVIPLSLSRV